jgi:hypothetical protein
MAILNVEAVNRKLRYVELFMFVSDLQLLLAVLI